MEEALDGVTQLSSKMMWHVSICLRNRQEVMVEWRDWVDHHAAPNQAIGRAWFHRHALRKEGDGVERVVHHCWSRGRDWRQGGGGGGMAVGAAAVEETEVECGASRAGMEVGEILGIHFQIFSLRSLKQDFAKCP